MNKEALDQGNDDFNLNDYMTPLVVNVAQVVAAVTGILAVFLAIYLYQEDRVKALHVVILSEIALVDIEASITNDVQVLYKSQPADNLSLVQVKLENIGNQAIRPNDYSQPIQFIFDNRVEVIEAEILESSPSNLGMTISNNQNEASLSPILLNPGDRAIIRFVIIDSEEREEFPSFRAEARIADVKNIKIIKAINDEFDKDFQAFFGWAILVISPFLIIILIVCFSIMWLTSGGDSANTQWANAGILYTIIAMLSFSAFILIIFAIYRLLY